MTNKTQCPNCLTIYYITDEQFKKSKGKVRCGTCRQPFRARFLSDTNTDRAEPAHETTQSDDSPKEEKGHSEQIAAGDPIAHDANAQVAQEEQNFDSSPSDEQGSPDHSSYPVSRLAAQSDAEIAEDAPQDEDAQDEQPISSLAENLHSELSVRFDIEPPDDDAEALITQVDSLITERFPDSENSALSSMQEDPSAAGDDDFLLLKRRAHPSKLVRWFGLPILFVASLLLVGALLTQLWYRQALPGLEGSQVAERLSPMVSTGARWLEQTWAIDIPQRTDLSNLRLVSATVVPHPERASTTLLKVSLHNSAQIAQPYPWLELRLIDENGRLVARRPLAPQDYLFNNRLPKLIKPRELRKVSIELLAFPQQAHGYELKIIRPEHVR